jgi:hypothetical protein
MPKKTIKKKRKSKTKSFAFYVNSLKKSFKNNNKKSFKNNNKKSFKNKTKRINSI